PETREIAATVERGTGATEKKRQCTAPFIHRRAAAARILRRWTTNERSRQAGAAAIYQLNQREGQTQLESAAQCRKHQLHGACQSDARRRNNRHQTGRLLRERSHRPLRHQSSRQVGSIAFTTCRPPESV